MLFFGSKAVYRQMTASTVALSHASDFSGTLVPRRISRSLTCIEFFAGIGLTHVGLRSRGWECIYANDIDPNKKTMYESYFGQADYYQVGDVWQTDQIVSKIPRERADLATASFPCVDLSLAGNLKGLSGSESGAFYGFVKVMRRLRECRRAPRAVLVENVLGFLTSHKGKHLRVALQELAELGYYVDAFVVDAKHFTPQSRQRLFIVGFQKDLLPAVPTRLSNRTWQLKQPTTNSLRPGKLAEILSETELKTGWVPLYLPPLPAENRNLRGVIDISDVEDWWNLEKVRKHLAEMHSYHRELIEQLKKGEGYTVGTIYRRVRGGKSKSEVRTDGLAGCLRTPRGGSSKQIVLIAGKGEIRMRWMTPREYARLQGCPDFPIEVERNEALWGFGDAVCVPVIEWIDRNVLTQIFPGAKCGESE
jgi:DNA (cytosine-5)-methyltransferase 1